MTWISILYYLTLREKIFIQQKFMISQEKRQK